jgi:hypothetical protein
MATFIELGDGSSFEMEVSRWKIAASATGTPLDAHDTTARLVVRTDELHRVLIYVELENRDHTLRMGELLPPESPRIISTLQSMATLYGMPPSCFESCLEQLYRK